jgi:hypothetical protein
MPASPPQNGHGFNSAIVRTSNHLQSLDSRFVMFALLEKIAGFYRCRITLTLPAEVVLTLPELFFHKLKCGHCASSTSCEFLPISAETIHANPGSLWRYIL